MASKASLVEFIVGQLGDGVRARPMFGEFGVYRHGQLIALICRDQLFMKPTEAARAMLEKVDEAPPYPGAKPSFRISEEDWDDAELMEKLAEVTARALLLEKPKKAPKRKAAAATTRGKAAPARSAKASKGRTRRGAA